MMQTCVPRNIGFSLWLGMLLSMNSINLCRLVILQKRIIRNISKSHFNAHTDPIFKDLGILKFNDILLVQLGQFMYCKNSFLPPRANDNFSRSNQFHSYNTRNSQAYRLPYWRTNTKKFSPFFKGLRFLVHLTKRSSTLNPLLLEKPEDSTKSLCTFKLPWDAHTQPQVSAGIVRRGISHVYFSPILLRLWQLLITVSYQLLFRLFFFYSRRAPHYIFQLLLSGFFPFLCSVASQVDSALVLNYNLMRRPLDMFRV